MTTLGLHTEKELQLLASGGDQQAFNEIFGRFKLKLYSYLHKITGSHEQAEDIVQEVFIKVWEHRATMGEIENLNAWLFRVAQNKAINSFKKWARDRKLIEELLSYNPSSGVNAMDAADYSVTIKEAEKIIHQGIEHLTPQQKLIYKMSREEGLKHEEIAEQLGLSAGTVKNHMIRALRTLRDYVQKNRGTAAIWTVFVAVVEAFEK